MSPLPFFKDATKDFEIRTIAKTALCFISQKWWKMKPNSELLEQAVKNTFMPAISNSVSILQYYFSISIIRNERQDILGGCGYSFPKKQNFFFGFCGELSTVCCCPAFFYFLDEGGCQMLWGHLLGPPWGWGFSGDAILLGKLMTSEQQDTFKMTALANK